MKSNLRFLVRDNGPSRTYSAPLFHERRPSFGCTAKSDSFPVIYRLGQRPQSGASMRPGFGHIVVTNAAVLVRLGWWRQAVKAVLPGHEHVGGINPPACVHISSEIGRIGVLKALLPHLKNISRIDSPAGINIADEQTNGDRQRICSVAGGVPHSGECDRDPLFVLHAGKVHHVFVGILNPVAGDGAAAGGYPGVSNSGHRISESEYDLVIVIGASAAALDAGVTSKW